MVINDLVVDGDKGLAGYWGGFSGDVDGTSLGFLSPHYNGNDFHGKAVKVTLPTTSKNTRVFECVVLFELTLERRGLIRKIRVLEVADKARVHSHMHGYIAACTGT